jgi:hypothetical protein
MQNNFLMKHLSPFISSNPGSNIMASRPLSSESCIVLGGSFFFLASSRLKAMYLGKLAAVKSNAVQRSMPQGGND